MLCSIIYLYYKMTERKAKLLRKYLGEVKQQKTSLRRQGILIKDQEEIELNSSISSPSASEDKRENRRVADSDSDQQPNPKTKGPEEVQKKSKAVTKGLRKALGLKKGEDVDEFVEALKIEGVGMKVIESYLKSSKEGLKMQSKKEKKEKKKKEKKRIRDQSESEKQESEGSDLVIPQQARTIYRDKQGRIKDFSDAKQKEMKQQAVMNRLAEWEKGMKNNEDEIHEEQEGFHGVWDDPARRWQSTLRHPMRCPYQGYANRFNIKPGFRWDGVIRGNGFENKYLQQINLRKAKESQEHRDYLKNL